MTLIEFGGLRHLRVKYGSDWIIVCEVITSTGGRRTYFPTGAANQVEGTHATCFACFCAVVDILRDWESEMHPL